MKNVQVAKEAGPGDIWTMCAPTLTSMPPHVPCYWGEDFNGGGGSEEGLLGKLVGVCAGKQM